MVNGFPTVGIWPGYWDSNAGFNWYRNFLNGKNRCVDPKAFRCRNDWDSERLKNSDYQNVIDEIDGYVFRFHDVDTDKRFC